MTTVKVIRLFKKNKPINQISFGGEHPNHAFVTSKYSKKLFMI